MKILLTGATGFIGNALSRVLVDQGHSVYAWVRDLGRANAVLDDRVNGFLLLEEIRDKHIEAIINLAGEPIADKRWTESRKQQLRDSRIGLTNQLHYFFKVQNIKPSVVLSGSAIGYYGSQDREQPLDELAEPLDGFSHELCNDWEESAHKFSSRSFANKQTRVCLLRTGIVLGQNGGALKKMLPPFRLGLGGTIGDGQQVLSWIHLQDWINACLFLLSRNELSGPFNLVSPNPVDNRRFTQALGRAVHRPALFRVPCLPLKLVLGEASELLCKGQRVIPKKLLFAGFKFTYPHIDQALAQIVQTNQS